MVAHAHLGGASRPRPARSTGVPEDPTSDARLHSSLAELAERAVPVMADHCAIHLVGADGGLALAIHIHSDPRRCDQIRELTTRWPLRPGSMRGIAAAFHAVEPFLVPLISRQMLSMYALDDDHARALWALDMRSAIFVPLVVDAKACGVLTLLMADSGRDYGPDDLEPARELAARMSQAVAQAP